MSLIKECVEINAFIKTYKRHPGEKQMGSEQSSDSTPFLVPPLLSKDGCIGVYRCNETATELPSNNLKGSHLFLVCVFTSYNTGQVSKQCHAKVEKET